ncbi:MAG: hypothetical protein ACOVSW_22880, partial [Candidatus Kapaibacteriota bacterium]
GRTFCVGFELEDSNDAPFGNSVIHAIELESEGRTKEVLRLISNKVFSAIQTALDNLLWEEFDGEASYHEKAYWHDNPAATYY